MGDEQWRSVVGYEGLYEVSNLGRVRSVPRLACCGYRVDGSPHYRQTSAKIMSQKETVGGYMLTPLYKEGHKRKLVHRLVLEAFVGPCPPGMEACHADGNPKNNALTNLRWDTPKSNAADRIRHGTSGIGESNPRCLLKAWQVSFIRAVDDKSKGFAKRMSEMFSVGVRTINAVRWGESWPSVTAGCYAHTSEFQQALAIYRGMKVAA